MDCCWCSTATLRCCRRPAVKQLREAQTGSDAAATLITTTLADPSGYGRVILDDVGNVAAIVEHKDANAEQLQVRVINSGIYCFRAKAAVEAHRRD